MKKNINSPLQNEKGFASVEATILIVLFVSLTWYSFGFFGAVHTGVIHNIHARTYAYETFRHRANLMYFRSNRGGANPLHYYNKMVRLHGINTDTRDFAPQQTATERPISFGQDLDEEGRDSSVHNRDVMTRVPAGSRNTSVGVNPIWITVLYGICLDSRCGG